MTEKLLAQGDEAKIRFHPTTNINIVARKIGELEVGEQRLLLMD